MHLVDDMPGSLLNICQNCTAINCKVPELIMPVGILDHSRSLYMDTSQYSITMGKQISAAFRGHAA